MIEALEHSAFLDIISPPYSDGNPCTYYAPSGYGLARAALSWLECSALVADGDRVQLSVSNAPDHIGAYTRDFNWTTVPTSELASKGSSRVKCES